MFDLNLYLCAKFMAGSSDTHRAQKVTLTVSSEGFTEEHPVACTGEQALFKEWALGNYFKS